MFRELCARYFPCVRPVGGGDAGRKLMHGHGCLLDSSHVITALHVIRQAAKYETPIVFLHDGPHRAECVYEREPLDIGVLRIGDSLEVLSAESTALLEDGPATEFPAFAEPRHIAIGMQVCYLSRPDYRPFFSPGFISTRLPVARTGELFRYLLAGTGIVQGGFSGSPAFSSTGELVGVITQSAKHVDGGGNLPILSAACFLRDEIGKALKRGA